jgi:predicted AAA+ superfamily ATPase
MIHRGLLSEVTLGLARQAAVGLIGPRQVGKKPLTHEIAASRPSVYLDLESPTDRNKLTDPELYHRTQSGKLVILDEIHQAPEIFQSLRGLIDEGRRQGQRTGRFFDSWFGFDGPLEAVGRKSGWAY